MWEEKAVRLATLPNMRVDASLNAIGVFMFSSTSLMGAEVSKVGEEVWLDAKPFNSLFFVPRKHKNLSFFVTCELMT